MIFFSINFEKILHQNLNISPQSSTKTSHKAFWHFNISSPAPVTLFSSVTMKANVKSISLSRAYRGDENKFLSHFSTRFCVRTLKRSWRGDGPSSFPRWFFLKSRKHQVHLEVCKICGRYKKWSAKKKYRKRKVHSLSLNLNDAVISV